MERGRDIIFLFVSLLFFGGGENLGRADSGASHDFTLIHRLVEDYSYQRIGDTHKLASTIHKYSSRYKVDPLLALAVLHEESHFKTDAVSSKGALGLMQVMPETGREIASNLNIRNFTTHKIFDPYVNVRMGIWYLMFLKKKFNNNRLLVLTAYNIGPTRLVEMRGTGHKFDYHYAKKVLKTYRRFQHVRNQLLAQANTDK